MSEPEHGGESSAKAFDRLRAAAHEPPATYPGAPDYFGFGPWIAKLQGLKARYDRALKRERRMKRDS